MNRAVRSVSILVAIASPNSLPMSAATFLDAEFLARSVNIALPRVRDFRGLNNKSFDGRGNYALGIKEQIVFPEIEYDKVDEIRGMDIIVVTTAKTDDEARELLRGIQFPFGTA